MSTVHRPHPYRSRVVILGVSPTPVDDLKKDPGTIDSFGVDGGLLPFYQRRPTSMVEEGPVLKSEGTPLLRRR